MSAKEQADGPQAALQHHPGDAEEKAESEQRQIKRSRGRPKGSTNKKRSAAAESSNAQSAEGKQHRKRGRPPKVTKTQDTEDGEPPRKKRGRPPKINTAESSTKQKKGGDDDDDDNDDGADSEIQPTTSATSEFAPDGPSTSAAPIPRKRGRPPKTTS